MTTLFLGNLGTGEIIIILAIFVVIPFAIIGLVKMLSGSSSVEKLSLADQAVTSDNFILKPNRLVSAFSMLAISSVLLYYPGNSWIFSIAKLYAAIFYVIAVCQLIKHAKDAGKTGAIILLIASALDVISTPFSFFNDLMNFIENGLSMFGGGYAYVNPYQYWLDIADIAQYLLYIPAYIFWLTYPSFQKMRGGIITLLIVSLFFLAGNVFSISAFYNPVANYLSWILGIISVFGYYSMATNASITDQKANGRTKAMLLSAIGLIYSMAILVDNSYTLIFTSLIGTIIWLSGISKIKQYTLPHKGLGGFNAYGVLTILSSLFFLIPVLGGYIALLFQIPAFICLASGFFSFSSNPYFHKNPMCGMKTLGMIAILSIGSVIVFAIPVIGEYTSALTFCILYVPIILWSWRNALNAQSMEAIPIDTPAAYPIPLKQELSTDSAPLSSLDVKGNLSYDPISYMPKNTKPYQKANEDEKNDIQPTEKLSDTKKVNHTNPQTPANNLKPLLFTGAGLFLLAGIVIGYLFFYVPYKRDKDAPRYYTFSNITNLRSSQIAGTDFGVLEKLPYGTELITYTYEPEWSEVKLKTGKKEITGYIASPFIIPEDDFFRLNSAFGDNESRECISTAKCRLALLDYLKRNHFNQKVNELSQNNEHNKEWQVYAKPENVKPNTVFFPRLFDRNSKFTDFAVIIKNNNTGERRLFIYSFTENETPVFRYEENAPRSGDIKNIQTQKSGDKFYIKVIYTD